MSNAPRPDDFVIDRHSFTVNVEGKSLVTELSDLGITAAATPKLMTELHSRGLWMRTKSGVWARWVWSDDENDDGEPVFVPDETSVRKVPALAGWRMFILND